MTLPEISADSEICREIENLCRVENALELLEAHAREDHLADQPFLRGTAWHGFTRGLLDLWRSADYVIVRGLPAFAGGASMLLASLWCSRRFRTYRDGKIVKTFQMSPWTTDLSHTIREGHFHTDLNTDPRPPAVTVIQCKTPDPGAPAYGVNRVARISDVLTHSEAVGDQETLKFLQTVPVTMTNDRSPDSWTGRIVKDGQVRFHPETLRAAARRAGNDPEELECRLAAVHAAALAVSTPFWLDIGDTLFVSNFRALHYRGECSVSFLKFPLEFKSRAIHVMHLLDEPQ